MAGAERLRNAWSWSGAGEGRSCPSLLSIAVVAFVHDHTLVVVALLAIVPGHQFVLCALGSLIWNQTTVTWKFLHFDVTVLGPIQQLSVVPFVVVLLPMLLVRGSVEIVPIHTIVPISSDPLDASFADRTPLTIVPQSPPQRIHRMSMIDISSTLHPLDLVVPFLVPGMSIVLWPLMSLVWHLSTSNLLCQLLVLKFRSLRVRVRLY